jgi:hypothetical protein
MDGAGIMNRQSDTPLHHLLAPETLAQREEPIPGRSSGRVHHF